MPEFIDKIKDFFDGDDDDRRITRRDGEDTDACFPGRWVGIFTDNEGREHRNDVTRDDEAWLLVLFGSVLNDDEAIRRKAEEWRELFGDADV